MRALPICILGCLSLTGCPDGSGSRMPDMTPVGNGLEFLGIAGVLMTLIVVIAMFLRK